MTKQLYAHLNIFSNVKFKSLSISIFLLTNSNSFAINAEHQGTNLEFTVVQKLHQGTTAKRGVIVWRAPFLPKVPA